MIADPGRRLELLLAAGELADRTRPAEEVLPKLLALVVPDVAAGCLVHHYRDGVVALTAVHGDAPARPEPPVRPEEDAVPAGDGAVVAPLRVRGRTTGWLTYLTVAAGEDDLRFLRVLTNRMAVALDNARLVLAERQLEALVDGMEDAVSVRDAAGRIVLANRAAVELLGARSLEELHDTPMEELWRRFALYAPDGRPLAEADLGWARALNAVDAPEPVLMRRVVRATGEQQWLQSKATVLRGGDGRATLVMNVTEDVTARMRSEQGRRLLVEAGRLLSEATDFPGALQDIAELVVPAFADWCGIDLPGPSGFLQLTAAAHVDPEKVAQAHRLREAHPHHLDDDHPVAGVVRTGVPVRVEIDEAMLRDAATDEEHLASLRLLGLAALLSVPVRSGDEVLGALTLIASQPERRFDATDQEMAEALARRIGDALRNARLLRDRAEIAHVLSSGLRPDPAPVLPGCEIVSMYRPAGEDVEAGGDFYEVVDAPSGSIVVMGDVVGKGAPAAALSAVARVTLRTAGRLTGDPRAALDELNRTLRARGGMSLCTAAAVALPAELPGEAQILLAGHPQPLLVRDGRARPLGEHGPMLGAVDVADWVPVTEELAPNDVLVLYTDGILDAALPGGERFGEARLVALVEEAGCDVEAIRSGLEARLPQLRLRDDIALLAVRCPGPPPLLVRDGFDGTAERLLGLALPGGPDAPGAARRALTEALGGRLGATPAADALLVLSELVTNAIRHGGARGPGDEVRVDAALLAEDLRLEVTDPGPGFEPGGHGPRADGGYGLHLLDRIARRWGVAGSHPVTVWVELAR